jgi:tripartite-type tricarboxylate transporter receptor subunit TctC
MTHVRTTAACLALAVACLLGPAPASAQSDFPSQDFHIPVAFPAGSGADLTARFFANALSEKTGRAALVDNKPGAFGIVATQAAANARPDGYTIGIGPANSLLASINSLVKKVPFDPVKDLTIVTTLWKSPFVLGVAANGPIKTVADLSKMLLAKGDKVAWGTAAATSVVTAELYKDAVGFKGQRISYKGPADIATGLVAGELDFSFFDMGSGIENEHAGRIRLLAVTSGTRNGSRPDVPTMTEAGVPGFDISSWGAAFVPSGTPPEVVAKLSGWFNEILPTEPAKKFLAGRGAEPFPGSPAASVPYLRQQITQWTALMKRAGLEPQ